jgi:hypothetical protein
MAGPRDRDKESAYVRAAMRTGWSFERCPSAACMDFRGRHGSGDMKVVVKKRGSVGMMRSCS